MKIQKIEETLETITAATLFVVAAAMISACGGSRYQRADANHDGRVSASECVSEYLNTFSEKGEYSYADYSDCLNASM